MFSAIYKTTFKNLFRSVIFWMMFVVFGFVVFELLTKGSHGYFSFEYNEMIRDTDPRYVIDYHQYIQRIYNIVQSTLMYYAMPLFTSVSVVIILNRDYGDNYYEIEKAAGVKPAKYIFGRLAALVTINYIVVVLLALAILHIWIYTRGGVPALDLQTYIIDSTVRMIRLVSFYAMPALLFYIGFTYFIGSLFRSGFMASVCSIGYVIFYAVVNLMFRSRIAPWYFEYLSTSPKKLGHYLMFYDTDLFETFIMERDTDLGKAAICFGALVGLALLYSSIAYLRTRKRDR